MMNWKVCNKPLKMVVVWLFFFPQKIHISSVKTLLTILFQVITALRIKEIFGL